jgi:hypothetical protein
MLIAELAVKTLEPEEESINPPVCLLSIRLHHKLCNLIMISFVCSWRMYFQRHSKYQRLANGKNVFTTVRIDGRYSSDSTGQMSGGRCLNRFERLSDPTGIVFPLGIDHNILWVSYVCQIVRCR